MRGIYIHILSWAERKPFGSATDHAQGPWERDSSLPAGMPSYKVPFLPSWTTALPGRLHGLHAAWQRHGNTMTGRRCTHSGFARQEGFWFLLSFWHVALSSGLVISFGVYHVISLCKFRVSPQPFKYRRSYFHRLLAAAFHNLCQIGYSAKTRWKFLARLLITATPFDGKGKDSPRQDKPMS